MRWRLLAITLVAMSGLGADCGGGGGGSASNTSTNANTTPASSLSVKGGSDGSPVLPEPSAMLVFGVGLVAAGVAIRRRS